MNKDGIHKPYLALLAALFVFVLVPGTSAAQTVTFQRGDGKGAPSETDDAELRAGSPTGNFSTGTSLNIDGSPHIHAVLKFPNIFGSGPNQIPLGSTINSATVTLRVTGTTNVNPTVYQITESWVESEVTWNSRSTGVSWTNPGADGTGSHRATADGSFPMGSTGFQSMAVTTSVQYWSNGWANEGWVFVDNSTNGANFRSSEYGTVADRPELTVTYTPPCAPATLPFTDNFTRANSSTVGNCWVETESVGNDATISTNRLVFVTNNADNFPRVERSFTAVSSGVLRWTFVLDWTRTPTENFYSIFMQLGNSATFAAPPADGGSVAGAGVNLRWGDDNLGFTAEEGFGYQQGTIQTQVTTLTGLNTIEVTVNLNTETFDLKVNGTTVASGVGFDKSLAAIGGSIDAVRIYQGEGVASGTGGNQAFDDLTIEISTASPATSTITASPTSITADGVTTSTITVQLKDAAGINLTTGGDAVTLATTLGTLSAVTDNNNGTYTATLTSATTAGTATITGTVNAAAIVDDATVSFTAGPATQYLVTSSSSSPVAGSDVTITAQLADVNGNAVSTAGNVVTWSSTNGGSFGTATSTTNASGVATVVFTTSTTAGTVHTVTGTDGGGLTGTSGNITTVAGPASAATSLITAAPTSITADGASIAIITVQLKDANGNDLTTGGDAVTLASTLGTLSGVTDNGDGTYTAQLTAGTITGTATITGTVNAVAITDNATVTFTAPALGGLNVALVCGTAACADANKDVPMRNHLTSTLGHTVTNFDDNDQTWTPTLYDVVVISESVGSSNTAWLKAQAVGIFTVEGANNDELEMGSGGSSSGGGDTQINITDNSHYITSVFPLGVRTVTTVATNLGYMSGWANGVTKLAHYSSNSTLAKLLYVDNGGVLQGGINTAAERRAFFAAQYFADLTADGITLFTRSLNWAAYNTGPTSAAVSGTLTPSATEAQIVSGGETLIITLTNDTWVAAGAVFDAQRQNIINGLTSAGAEAAGWNAVVRGGLAVTDVVRTSNTVVTITLPAFASYDISLDETITVTVPATAVSGGSAIVATPTFDVTAVPPATLVVRYWLDEAPSGQAPTQLIDDQASPLNLPITYDGANPTYTVLPTGRGWESTTTGNGGRASTLVDATKIQTTLNGSTAATIEIVVRVDALSASNSRLIHLGAGSESGYLTLSSGSVSTLYFYMFGETLRGQWDPGFDGSRMVFHLVYDSRLATAADRVKLYKNGVLQTKTGGIDPPQNETISVPNGKNFDIANRTLCCRSFDGAMYYAAIYDGALTASDVSANTTALLANDDNNTYAVAVMLDGADTLNQLPTNGTSYAYKFTVTNNSDALEDFDLFGFPGDTLATFLTVDSIVGPSVTQGATPDSARITGVPASSSDSAFVWYSVANVAAGTLDSLYLKARSISSSTVSDSGWVFSLVIKPNITTAKAVSPSGTQPPGTDLTYTVTITNDGSDSAVSVVIVDSLAVEVEFQVGSVVNNLPAGITVTVEYSNDGASTWTYTPVSAGCGAPSGYDGCVTHIRWTLQNNLSSTPPNNTGNVEFVARIQ